MPATSVRNAPPPAPRAAAPVGSESMGRSTLARRALITAVFALSLLPGGPALAELQ